MSDDQTGSVWDNLDPTKAGFGAEKPEKVKRAKRIKPAKAPKTSKVAVPLDDVDVNLSEGSRAAVNTESDEQVKRESKPLRSHRAPRNRGTSRSPLRKIIPAAVVVTCLGAGFGGGYAVASSFGNVAEEAQYRSTVDPDSGWLHVENIIEGMPGSAMTILDRGFAEQTVKDKLNPVADEIAAQLSEVVGTELMPDGDPVYPDLLLNDDKEAIVVQSTTSPRSAFVEHDDELGGRIIEAMNAYSASSGEWSEPQVTEQEGGFFLTSYRNDDPMDAWTVLLGPAPVVEGNTVTDVVSVTVTSAWHVPEGKEALLEEYVIQKVKAKAQSKAE